MINRHIPIYLKYAPTPSVWGFAVLAGLEACVRGMLISVMPLAVYRAFADAAVVSKIYFAVGVVSLLVGLMVPWLNRFVARRWMYSIGVAFYVLGAVLALIGGPTAISLALLANSAATATVFVCFNAYLLDYIARSELGRSQSMQMVFAAAAWSTGPVLGVWLLDFWEPLPFLLSGGFALVLVTVFWWLRLGNGKEIQRARTPAPNPLAFLGRFAAQPRLVAGWLFAVIRSCGWWVYVVYVPIFCIENGLGDKIGGTMLSASNFLLFTAPVMLGLVHRTSVRRAVIWAFVLGGAAFVLSAMAAPLPWAAVALIGVASVFLVALDVAGGLPFLMAVKPSERTEMAAVFASYRDVSGILTPGVAWLVLLAMPLAGIFAASGAAMLAAAGIALRLHPRLGSKRPSRGGKAPMAAE